MTEQNTAVSLMRMALALLDRDGMRASACHLEQAICMASNDGSVEEDLPDPTIVAAYMNQKATDQQTGSRNEI